MDTLLQLFRRFVLIGIGAYGGGLVTIPLIQHEIVQVQGWLLPDELASMLAIAQMTPGPIAVNIATFVGVRISGVAGAAVATLSVLLPALLILGFAAPFIDRISRNRYVQRVRRGLELGVLSLILFAVWSYGSVVISGWVELALGTAAFAALVTLEGRAHPILVILGSGVLGLFLF